MDVVEAVEAGDIEEGEDPASAASSPEEMPHLPDLVPKQATVSHPFPLVYVRYSWLIVYQISLKFLENQERMRVFIF